MKWLIYSKRIIELVQIRIIRDQMIPTITNSIYSSIIYNDNIRNLRII